VTTIDRSGSKEAAATNLLFPAENKFAAVPIESTIFIEPDFRSVSVDVGFPHGHFSSDGR